MPLQCYSWQCHSNLYIFNNNNNNSFWANVYPKLQILAIFVAVSPHFFTVRTVKFGVSVRTLDTLPAFNFVKKIAQRDLSLGRNFYQKFEIFEIFSYLSPYFYTDNVKILLKGTDRLRNPSKKQIFVKIAQGACRYCIASVVMHTDF